MEETCDEEEEMNSDNPLHRFILFDTALEMGLVPLLTGDDDLKEALQQMDPEEARYAKRKYRKLWRKLVINRFISKHHANKYYGVGFPQPSRGQLNTRKHFVFYEILRRAGERLRDLKNNVEHPEEDKL